ncbi:MAG TPA: DUF1269 domain-containing protein [Anaerolineae bacterium]|nr:DUF1269 domain-containing protein [Anaerolineae bacterium]
MYNVVAITFADQVKAEAVYKNLQKMEKKHWLNLEDVVLVAKDKSGKVTFKLPMDHTGASGTSESRASLFAGLMLGGAAFGAFASADRERLKKAWAERGFNRQFAEKVGQSLTPESSAIFIMYDPVSDDEKEKVMAQLRGLGGQLYTTSLSEEDATKLQNILDGKEI